MLSLMEIILRNLSSLCLANFGVLLCFASLCLLVSSTLTHNIIPRGDIDSSPRLLFSSSFPHLHTINHILLSSWRSKPRGRATANMLLLQSPLERNQSRLLYKLSLTARYGSQLVTKPKSQTTPTSPPRSSRPSQPPASSREPQSRIFVATSIASGESQLPSQACFISWTVRSSCPLQAPR